MECCDSGPCGPPCVVDLDGVSIREVMEVLRGVSREEIISQLEGIGFYFDEKEIVKQLNRLDTEAQRRVMREAGILPGKKDLVEGLKELPPTDVNQVLLDAEVDEIELSENIVTAGFRKLRPEKAKLIVEECKFNKYIVAQTILETSYEEMNSLFRSLGAPYTLCNEVEIANVLKSFTDCQQKACLTMAGLDRRSVKEVIEIIQDMDEAQQIRIGRECFLEPTDQQLVKILTEYPVSRLSKLMREVAFVPRNDDCVNILSNMEPGSRNAVMARVNWEPPLSWLVEQVDKLNKAEMERIAEIVSVRVCLPDEAIINTFKQSTPEVVGQILREVGIVLPVSDISRNLKRLLPDEASHAIQRARIEKLSMECVVAGLKLMRPDVVKRVIRDSGHPIVDDEEAIDFLRNSCKPKQIELVKTAGVDMIEPIEEEIEPTIKSWNLAQQGSLLRRLGWHRNVEFMVQALKNMEYSKQLQVLEEANVKPKMTVELTIEYLMTLQPKVLDDLIERAKYLPNKDLIIEAMKELDHDGQRLIVKRIGYVPPQMDIVEALQQMTPNTARETTEIAEVTPRPSPELIADTLLAYPEPKRHILLDSHDILPSEDAMTKKMKSLSFDEQRQIFLIGKLKIPVNRGDVIDYIKEETADEVATLLKVLGPEVLNDDIVSLYLRTLTKAELSRLAYMSNLEVILKDEEHVREYLLSLDVVKQKKMTESLPCFTEYNEVVKLVKSINPDHKTTLVRDCELPVKPTVDEMVTFYFDLSHLRQKDFIKGIEYIPTVVELGELLRNYDVSKVAAAILAAGLILPRSLFGPIKSADEVVKTLEETPPDIIDHGLRMMEFKAGKDLSALALKHMTQEEFSVTIGMSGKCLALGPEELKGGLSSLGACDAGSVATAIAPGNGTDMEMCVALMKRMNHADHMNIINVACVHAIEESDAAVGRYLSKIERKRVLQLLLANDIRFDSFEELLNLVKNLDEKDFSRLIRESKLTPDLELDLIIRAVRKLGNSAVHEMFSSLNYVPTREELIRIMKEVETHTRAELILECDVTLSVSQLAVLGEKLTHDEQHHLFDVLHLQREFTDDEIFCHLTKMSEDKIIDHLMKIGFKPNIDMMATGLKKMNFEHQNVSIKEGAGDVAKFVEEENLVEVLRRLRCDQVLRAIRRAGIVDILAKDLFKDLGTDLQMTSEDVADYLQSSGMGNSIVAEFLRRLTADQFICVLKMANQFPFDVEMMVKSFESLGDPSQAQFFRNIAISDATLLHGLKKYSHDFKRTLILSIEYQPTCEELIVFLSKLGIEEKREIIRESNFHPEPADVVYAFRSVPPRDISTLMHASGIEVYPLESDCIRVFKEEGNDFANRVLKCSNSLPDKDALQAGLLALDPMQQQQVIACVGIEPPLCEPLLLETLKLLRPDECKRAIKEAGFTFDSEEELVELMMKKSKPQQEEILRKAGAHFVALTEKGLSEGLSTFTTEKVRQVLSMIGKYPPSYEDTLAGFKLLTIDKQREFLAESGSRALPTEQQLEEGFHNLANKGEFLLKIGYVPEKSEFIELLNASPQLTRREVITSVPVTLEPVDVSNFLKELGPQDGEAAIIASGLLAVPTSDLLLKALQRQPENVVRKLFKDIDYTADADDVVKGLQASSTIEIGRIFRLANVKAPVSEENVVDGLKTLRPDESHRAVKHADIGNPLDKDIIAALKSMSDHEQLQIVKASGMGVIPATEAAVADFLKNKLKAKQRQILKSIQFPSYLDLIEMVKDLDLPKQWQLIEDAHIDYFQRLMQDSEKLQVVLIEGLKQCTSVQQAHIIKHACNKLPAEVVEYYLTLIQCDERRRIYRDVGPYPNEHSSLCELVQIVTCMSPKDRYDFMDMIIIDDLPNEIIKKTLKPKRPTELQELIQELEYLMEPYGPLCRRDPDKIRCFVIDYLRNLSDLATKELLKLSEKCLISLLTVPPKDCVPIEPVTRLLNGMPHADSVEAVSKTDLQLRALILRNLLEDVAVRKLMNYPTIEELVTEILSLKNKDLGLLMKRIICETPFEQFLTDDILLKILINIPTERRNHLVSTSCCDQLLYPFHFPNPDMITAMIKCLPTGAVMDIIRHSGNCELTELCSELSDCRVICYLKNCPNADLPRIHDEIWSANGALCTRIDESTIMQEIECRVGAKLCEDAEMYKSCIQNEFEERKKEIESFQEAHLHGISCEFEMHVKSECCRLAEKAGKNLIDCYTQLIQSSEKGAPMENMEMKSLKAKKICDEVLAGGVYQAIPTVTQGICDLIHEYCAKMKALLNMMNNKSGKKKKKQSSDPVEAAIEEAVEVATEEKAVTNNDNGNNGGGGCNSCCCDVIGYSIGCGPPGCGGGGCGGGGCMSGCGTGCGPAPPQCGPCAPPSCGGNKILWCMNENMSHLMCAMDNLISFMNCKPGNCCSGGPSSCCKDECREIIERERERFRQLEGMMRDTINDARGTATMLVNSEVDKRLASDEDHRLRQMFFREDKEREIERLRIDVCELRSRFERDLAQKEIWFRDELDRRKNEYDRKIDELIRNQHEELEGIRHHCAEFNRDFENHMRCESDAKSNHVIAETRQNMMCEFEKELENAKRTYEDHACQLHLKYRTEIMSLDSAFARVLHQSGYCIVDESCCPDMPSNLAVLGRLKHQVHQIADYNDWLNKILEETKCREKQLRDCLDETRVTLQTEFSKYALEVERLDCELSDVKNQLKCAKEENFCLAKTLSDNEHEFEMCLKRADEHSRDLCSKLQEVEFQLATFCTHTHEPAIANATNKIHELTCLVHSKDTEIANLNTTIDSLHNDLCCNWSAVGHVHPPPVPYPVAGGCGPCGPGHFGAAYISTLSAEICHRNEVIDDLKSTISCLEEEIAALKNKLHAKDHECHELQQELARVCEQLNVAISDVEQLKQIKASLEADLCGTKNELHLLADRNSQLEHEKEALIVHNGELECELAKRCEEIKCLSEMNITLKHELDDALKRVDILEAELCNLRALITRLTEECQEKDQELCRLNAHVQALSTELHDVKCSLEASLCEVAALTEERDALNEAVEYFTSVMQEIRELITVTYEGLDIKIGGLLHCNDQCIPRPEIGPIVPHAHIRRGCALELHKKLFDSVSFTAETAVASVHRISASANQMILAASCLDGTISEREHQIEVVTAEAVQREHCLAQELVEQEAAHQKEVSEFVHQIDFLAQAYANYQNYAEEREQADCLNLSQASQILEHHEEKTSQLETDNFAKQNTINALDSDLRVGAQVNEYLAEEQEHLVDLLIQRDAQIEHLNDQNSQLAEQNRCLQQDLCISNDQLNLARETIENLNVVLCVHVEWWHHMEEFMERILGGFIQACDGECSAGIRCMVPAIIETSYNQALEIIPKDCPIASQLVSFTKEFKRHFGIYYVTVSELDTIVEYQAQFFRQKEEQLICEAETLMNEMQSFCMAAEAQDSVIEQLQVDLRASGDILSDLTNELNFVTSGAVTRAARLIQASLEVDVCQGSMEGYMLNLAEENSPLFPLVHDSIRSILELRHRVHFLETAMGEVQAEKDFITAERDIAECNQFENAKAAEELCEDKKKLLVEIDNMTCNVATLESAVEEQQHAIGHLDSHVLDIKCALPALLGNNNACLPNAEILREKLSQDNPAYEELLTVAKWMEATKCEVDRLRCEASKVPRLQNCLIQAESRGRELLAEISKLNSQMSNLAYEKEQIAHTLHDTCLKASEMTGLLEDAKESLELTRIDRDTVADEVCELRSMLETQIQKNDLLRESIGTEIAQVKTHIVRLINCCHSHPGPCCGSPCGSSPCRGHSCGEEGKMGQIICGMDEVLGKLLDENCAQAGLRADLGKTANCMDDLRRELLYERQCSAAKSQQITTLHVKLAESEKYIETLNCEKSQLRCQIESLQCQVQSDCVCMAPCEAPCVDSCTPLQGPGVCCTGAMELLSSWANEKRCLLGTIHSLKELISKLNRPDICGAEDWRRTMIIAVQQVFSKQLGQLYAEKVLLGALLPCGGVEQWNDMAKFDEKLACMEKSLWDSMEMLRAADRASLAAENAILKQRLHDAECCTTQCDPVPGCAGVCCPNEALHNGEIQKLKTQLCRSRDMRDAFERELEHYKAKAEDEIKHLRMENELNCAENDRLHKEMHKLQNQLCVAEDRIHELEHKLEDALQLLDLLEKQNYEQKVACLEAEIRSLKATLDDLSYHLSIVEGERDELARLLRSRDGLREELEAEVYELSRRLRDMEISGTDCLKMQIGELEDKLYEREKQLECCKKEQDCIIKQERYTRIQLSECENALGNVQNELQDKVAQVNEMSHQIRRLEDNEKSFQCGMMEMQKHIDSLVDENLTLNAVVGTQQGVTEEAHQTATRLKRHFTREVDCLRNDLDAAERNRIFLTERLRSLEEENEALKVDVQMRRIRTRIPPRNAHGHCVTFCEPCDEQ